MEYNINFANEIGVNGSIILNNIDYFVSVNNRNNTCLQKGKYWTFFSVSQLHEKYKVFSISQIRTAITKLERRNLILRSKIRKNGNNHTYWYTITTKYINQKNEFPLSGFFDHSFAIDHGLVNSIIYSLLCKKVYNKEVDYIIVSSKDILSEVPHLSYYQIRKSFEELQNKNIIRVSSTPNFSFRKIELLSFAPSTTPKRNYDKYKIAY